MHHHQQHHGIEDANKEYFTTNIAEFEKSQNIELAKRSANAMREHYPFNEETTTVMDFACGVGLISRELAPYAKSIIGVDIAQALVDNYNQRVLNQGISPEEMRAVCVELKGEEGELDGLKFDVIVCSVSYHHFSSVEDITKILAFFLKPGGSLLVVDILDPSDPLAQSPGGTSNTEGHVIPEKFHHIVAHTRGFKSDYLRTVFENAGLINVTIDEAVKTKRKDCTSISDKPGSAGVNLFIAKAEKPSA